MVVETAPSAEQASLPSPRLILSRLSLMFSWRVSLIRLALKATANRPMISIEPELRFVYVSSTFSYSWLTLGFRYPLRESPPLSLTSPPHRTSLGLVATVVPTTNTDGTVLSRFPILAPIMRTHGPLSEAAHLVMLGAGTGK